MELLIDLREPRSIFYYAKMLKIPYRSVKLDVGDFQTERTVFERKTVGDLIQSVYGQKVAQGYRRQRFFEQMDAMRAYCEETGRVGWLAISGTLEKVQQWFEKRQFGQRRLQLNVEAVYGAVASAIVRYGMHVVWMQTDEELVKVIWKIARKVEEGKFGKPRRSTLRKVHTDKRVALIANVLRVSPNIAERMFKRFGGLGKIIRIVEEKPQELWLIDGVGEKTIKRIRVLLGFDEE